MGKLLVLLMFLVFAQAETLFIVDTEMLAETNLRGKQYAAADDSLYLKKGEYYHLVYLYPKRINAAEFKDDRLITDKFTLQIYPKYIQRTDVPGSPQPRAFERAVALEVRPLIGPEDLDNDGQLEVVFRYDGRKVIGVWQNGLVKQVSTYKPRVENLAAPLDPVVLRRYSADELEKMRKAIAERKGKKYKRLTKIEKQNVHLLYKIEGEKRRAPLKEKPDVALPR